MSSSSLRLLAEVGRRLARCGESVAFLADGEELKLQEEMRLVAECVGGFLTLTEFAEPDSAPSGVAGLRDDNPTTCALLDYHATRFGAARRLIARQRPKAVIVAEDGVSGNAWIIEAARRAAVPVINCPYGYGTSRDLEGALARKEESGELLRLDGPYAEEIHVKAPQWIKRGRFEGALLFVPEYVVARERLGLSLRDPWVVQGGFSDRVCVESRQMLRHYRDEGLPEDVLQVTGTVYCDQMFDALRTNPAASAALHSGQKISPGETSLLVSWPPSYHAERGRLCEFETYSELTRTTLGFLASLENARTTVSLHPAMTPDDGSCLAGLPVTVAETNIIELIPQHDVFISDFSSMIRWAVAAGKPVVNYDFYRFDLIDYDAAPGVLTVRTFAEFEETVRGLVNDDRRYAAVCRLQNSVAADWGTIDGKATDNLLAVIRSLC